MACFATASHDQEGAVFLSEVPDDLMCVICSLVLKDPLQVMACGHRYCSCCFDKMRKRANDSHSDLLCAIDRNPVQMEKVFPDRAVSRTISNLKVKCKSYELGCDWTGCLGDENEHYSTCRYMPKLPKYHCPDNSHCKHQFDYTKLLQRVVKGEQDLESKEKDIVILKYTVKEMKEDSSKDKEEIKALKGSLAFLLNEVHILKQKNEQRVEKYDGEIKNLHEKSKLMEQGITDCQNEVQTMRDKKLASEEHIDQQMKIVEKKIETEAEGIRKEVGHSRIHVDESLNKQLDKISKVEDMMNNEHVNIDDLHKQIHLVENALFLFDSVKSRNVQFKWILENFDHHYNVGKRVYSPVFNSQVSGYRFLISVNWKGTNKENMGIFLKLIRGKNEDGFVQNLPPFRHEYTLEILNKDGSSFVRNVTVEDLQKPESQAYISILDGEMEVKGEFGFSSFISLPFDNYIIRDSMYIICTLDLV